MARKKTGRERCCDSQSLTGPEGQAGPCCWRSREPITTCLVYQQRPSPRQFRQPRGAKVSWYGGRHEWKVSSEDKNRAFPGAWR